MANRGFPLSIQQICVFAWCIVSDRGKNKVFPEKGQTRGWCWDFRLRHPEFSLQRPDALLKGRVAMGNTAILSEHFPLLKDTIEKSDLMSKP